MLCPVCKKNKAQSDPVLGILPCSSCQENRRKNILPNPVEMVGEQIKNDRQTYAKSIVQPFNSAGEFSDEYYQAHGTKGVKVTPQQVKNRKRLWNKAISDNIDINKTK
ncbi:MAG TPA: hypothetical protein VF941_11980 [Clostridia bacterium]